jgi:hypothetical protein
MGNHQQFTSSHHHRSAQAVVVVLRKEKVSMRKVQNHSPNTNHFSILVTTSTWVMHQGQPSQRTAQWKIIL